MLMRMPGYNMMLVMGQQRRNYCTHVGGLVERSGGSASGDSRATTGDHNVDALQLSLAYFAKNNISATLT
jgi:hypothetical protein